MKKRQNLPNKKELSIKEIAIALKKDEKDVLETRTKAMENFKTGLYYLDNVIKKAKSIDVDFVELERLVSGTKDYKALNMMRLAEIKIGYMRLANDVISIQNRMFVSEYERILI